MFPTFTVSIDCIGTIHTYQCYKCNMNCINSFDANATTVEDTVEVMDNEVCVVCIL